MITSDPEVRARRLSEIEGILSRDAAAHDEDMLLAFAREAFAAMPDGLALGLSVPVVAGRLKDYFRFFVEQMPPAHQLYKGLPGIHVVVANPAEDAAERTVHGRVLPHESTVVSTHTLDAPFVFESLQNYFLKAGLRVYSATHPILTVRRQWERIVWIGGRHEEGTKELMCRFRIERIESREQLRHIEHEIYCVLRCVFAAVEDYDEIRRGVREIRDRLRSRRGGEAEVAADRAFVEWLLDDNYIFMGSVCYRAGADGTPHRLHETAMGVFTDPPLLPVVFPGMVEEVESHILPGADDDRVIDIDYCHNASAIYHLEPIDDIVIREWAPDGSLSQATLLLGRFSMGAFAQRAGDMPLLREKLEWLLANASTGPSSYVYRQTRGLFNRFPKRELLYADLTSLKRILDAMISVTGDEEIVVQRRDGGKYVVLYLCFSRSRYSYKTERLLHAAFSEAFGPISFSLSDDCGAQNLLLIYFNSAELEHDVDEEKARAIAEPLITTWEDRVSAELIKAFGEREGRRLLTRYVRHETRSGLYREATPPEEIPGDVGHFEVLEGRLEVGMVRESDEAVTLKLFSPRPLGLAQTLTQLSNLGLEVVDDLRLPLRLPDGRPCFLFRLHIEGPPGRIAALLAGEERFIEALRALDEGRSVDGSLNVLVLDTGLSWREVALLRTLRNHLIQIRPSYNAETINRVLRRHSHVAAALFHAFARRFDPGFEGDRAAAVAQADAELATALEAVSSLSEDEVLRGLASLVRAGLRTNFYQRPGRPVIAIKVDSRRVEGMPSPRPMFEVYVHSPLLEGIHLRGGRVARGGIRWSERPDDFRTEVLGLMKTQMAKNSIIVPVGSKGGFVLKGNLPARPALDGYLVDRYREFVAGLLDVTDNLVDGTVLHPPEVVRHDGDDPYLVVAADKGTAHLSDTANRVSAQYGFWLGDAFASGGSVGYDHKKVGITARGAWECVKHHFGLLGRDIQLEPFSCVGIGDMSGDVFGNGMLLSRATKLVGAFNHLHIFVDPDPDPEASWRERERLFKLPRSTWKDYDRALISPGGGVFDRSAKAIPISPQMQTLLDIEADSASGEEVIRRLLCAQVDLLYNGGIGTYVRASGEEDEDVGDHANDRVRVTATDVRARVVGEGGNLGLTQKARIEYWAHGGSVNTDAVDNSGGVDCSDHEVNIKILMDQLVREGALPRKDRDRVFMEMQEEVALLVLQDNRAQARALTLDGLRSARDYEAFVEFVFELVAAGVLNRMDDAIPTRPELLKAPRERGLPRPLLAVVLGYTKIWAYEMVMETGFPDSQAGHPFLVGYFPERLRERYPAHVESHYLRREIVGTCAINHVINHAGITFFSRVMAETGAGFDGVLDAYLRAERQCDAGALRGAVAGGGVDGRDEHALLLEVDDAVEKSTLARLRGDASEGAAELLEGIRKRLEA